MELVGWWVVGGGPHRDFYPIPFTYPHPFYPIAPFAQVGGGMGVVWVEDCPCPAFEGGCVVETDRLVRHMVDRPLHLPPPHPLTPLCGGDTFSLPACV